MGEDVEAADRNRAGGDFHLFALAHALVGALAVDLDCRDRGGALHDVTGESCDLFIDLLHIEFACRLAPGALALGVVSMRRHAKANSGVVGLG